VETVAWLFSDDSFYKLLIIIHFCDSRHFTYQPSFFLRIK